MGRFVCAEEWKMEDYACVQETFVVYHVCETIIMPTVFHGTETLGMSLHERRRVNVLEMKCFS